MRVSPQCGHTHSSWLAAGGHGLRDGTSSFAPTFPCSSKINPRQTPACSILFPSLVMLPGLSAGRAAAGVSASQKCPKDRDLLPGRKLASFFL